LYTPEDGDVESILQQIARDIESSERAR